MGFWENEIWKKSDFEKMGFWEILDMGKCDLGNGIMGYGLGKLVLWDLWEKGSLGKWVLGNGILRKWEFVAYKSTVLFHSQFTIYKFFRQKIHLQIYNY